MLLRIGAISAIVGAVISVAAGIGFGDLESRTSTEAVLGYLASRPSWYWPMVNLGFIVGAILWAAAFVALSVTLDKHGRPLGWLGLASVVVGAGIHVVDSSISGLGLTGVATDWSEASGQLQADLVLVANTLLQVLDGTWASVITFFHGVPFLLFGFAVVLSRRYASWVGWLGAVGGAGSFVIGLIMFLGANLYPSYVVFAVVVSVWMVVVGIIMWRMAPEITAAAGFDYATR